MNKIIQICNFSKKVIKWHFPESYVMRNPETNDIPVHTVSVRPPAGPPHDRKCHYAATALCGVVLPAGPFQFSYMQTIIVNPCLVWRFSRPAGFHKPLPVQSVTRVCSPKSISIASLRSPRGFMNGHSARASWWLVMLHWLDFFSWSLEKVEYFFHSLCHWFFHTNLLNIGDLSIQKCYVDIWKPVS